MFKNIMIAVDGSMYTDAVLSMGIAMTRAFHSRALILTVADIRVFEWATAVGADGFVPIVPSGVYQDESRKMLEEKCDKVLEKCSEIAASENINFETEKVIGSPVDCIIEHSQICDLLVMGKRGEFARFDRKALGATIEAVSRNVRKPIIVVDRTVAPVKKILALYDGSAHANQALQFVGHMAETILAQVTVLCINSDADIGGHYAAEAEKYLHNFQVTVETRVIPGHPDKESLEFAEKGQFDLIAIGAYGHSRIREAILGSTTEHILRFSPCPVLLAR